MNDQIKDAILQQLKSLVHQYRMLSQDFYDFNQKNSEFINNKTGFTRQIRNMIVNVNQLNKLVIHEIFPEPKKPQQNTPIKFELVKEK